MEHVFKVIYMVIGIIMFITALTMLLCFDDILSENSRRICNNQRNAEVIQIE